MVDDSLCSPSPRLHYRVKHDLNSVKPKNKERKKSNRHNREAQVNKGSDKGYKKYQIHSSLQINQNDHLWIKQVCEEPDEILGNASFDFGADVMNRTLTKKGGISLPCVLE